MRNAQRSRCDVDSIGTLGQIVKQRVVLAFLDALFSSEGVIDSAFTVVQQHFVLDVRFCGKGAETCFRLLGLVRQASHLSRCVFGEAAVGCSRYLFVKLSSALVVRYDIALLGVVFCVVSVVSRISERSQSQLHADGFVFIRPPLQLQRANWS